MRITRALFLMLVLFAPWTVRAGALDDFVAAKDPHFAWRVERMQTHPEGTVAVLELTSQAWRTAEEMDRPVWRHWLEVLVPARVDHDVALLTVTGGQNSDPPPAAPNGTLTRIAVDLHAVTAHLWNVPNQPLAFRDDGKPRREDQLLARGWARNLETGDPAWLVQLAMARSAIRAMDAVSAFCATGSPTSVGVRKFVLTGGSKRGWTVWLAAAADPRVVGVAPRVIDLLNMDPSFRHHHAAYGRYADAVQDYVREGIVQHLGEPAMKASQAILDPWAYRDRLTMPKLLINSAGDQFFLPDSWRFYWNELQGPKYLRYIPNTDHGLNPSADRTIRAFFSSILTGRPLPAFTWRETAPGRIRIEAKDLPLRVLAWRVTNPAARDFMLKTTGPTWKAEDVRPSAPGVYEASAPAPKKGWTALLVELHYPDPCGSSEPLVLTSGVTVTPDTLPFAEKTAAQEKSEIRNSKLKGSGKSEGG